MDVNLENCSLLRFLSRLELKTMLKLDLELKPMTSDFVRDPPEITFLGANLFLINSFWKFPWATSRSLNNLLGRGSGASPITSGRKTGAKFSQAEAPTFAEMKFAHPERIHQDLREKDKQWDLIGLSAG